MSDNKIPDNYAGVPDEELIQIALTMIDEGNLIEDCEPFDALAADYRRRIKPIPDMPDAEELQTLLHLAGIHDSGIAHDLAAAVRALQAENNKLKVEVQGFETVYKTQSKALEDWNAAYNRLLKVAKELYDALNNGAGALEVTKHYETIKNEQTPKIG